ncbi:unnamed protein product [Paramecium sonneborni]|uniref:Protein kinase domain-containing protein n=1 Tax=Paramecium sonneborni TaxID=65129 RepID=A0A8S1LEC7_9CILI|nr:unnamed protein product [Paramecium sonneborni]
MNKLNIKFEIFTSNTGTLYQVEEEFEKKKTNYYAYNVQSNFQQYSLKKEEQLLKNCKSLRQYVKQIDFNNQKYILFEYVEGENLETKIKKHRGNTESISFELIKHYLTQILDTLYQLHQKNILGRVFSTRNILDCRGQLHFMDFGFGPKLMNQTSDIIVPPEIVKILREEQSPLIYNIKIDSWLLGAVLFHLVKLRPINAIEQNDTTKTKRMFYKDINEYANYLKIQMDKSKCIDADTDRYPKEFCQFIQGLLTYNMNDRFSFSQIYNNQFIKSLNLPKYQNYLRFYENFNEKQMIEEIKTIEKSESEILQTQELHFQQPNLYPYELIIPPLNFDLSPKNSENQVPFSFPSTSSRLQDGFQSELDDQNNIEKYFPHQIQGQYESRFYQIWQFIRMELFKHTYLEVTAEEFILELQKKKFQLEYVLAYLLRKMGYLILVELLEKVNEDICPWNCYNQQQDVWKLFKMDTQKVIFENNIKKKIIELGTILKGIFITHCQIYLKDERIEKVVRDELEADSGCFQRQQNDSHSLSIYKCRSEEFLKHGYRKFLQTTSKFLEREMKLAQKPEIKYNTMLLKSIICHLINRVFNLNQISLSFKGIMNGRKSKDLISPNEIYKYICRDAEQEKLQDLYQIYKVNFSSD